MHRPEARLASGAQLSLLGGAFPHAEAGGVGLRARAGVSLAHTFAFPFSGPQVCLDTPPPHRPQPQVGGTPPCSGEGCDRRPHSAVSIDSIQEVSEGRQSEIFQRYPDSSFDPNCCFSIYHGSQRQSLDLVSPSGDEARTWVTGLRYLMAGISDEDSLARRQRTRDQYPRAQGQTPGTQPSTLRVGGPHPGLGCPSGEGAGEGHALDPAGPVLAPNSAQSG